MDNKELLKAVWACYDKAIENDDPDDENEVSIIMYNELLRLSEQLGFDISELR